MRVTVVVWQNPEQPKVLSGLLLLLTTTPPPSPYTEQQLLQCSLLPANLLPILLHSALFSLFLPLSFFFYHAAATVSCGRPVFPGPNGQLSQDLRDDSPSHCRGGTHCWYVNILFSIAYAFTDDCCFFQMARKYR